MLQIALKNCYNYLRSFIIKKKYLIYQTKGVVGVYVEVKFDFVLDWINISNLSTFMLKSSNMDYTHCDRNQSRLVVAM